MRTLSILTAILAVSATPALAQHAGHPMPPADPAPRAAPTAAPVQASQPPAAQADMAAMPGMDAPTPDASDEVVGDEPAPLVPADFAADSVFDPGGDGPRTELSFTWSMAAASDFEGDDQPR
jgi:copper resistance protein B